MLHRDQVVPGREWLKRIHDRWPLLQSIRTLWSARKDRYSETRHLATPTNRPEMYRMGG